MNGLVLQRIVLPATAETAGLYLRHEGSRPPERVSAAIPPGGALDLDTYFNSFDENVWRRHTRLTNLAVELMLDGPARIELWRHSRAAPPALLAETSAVAGKLVVNVPPAPHPRAAGRLALRVRVAKNSVASVTLLGGRWMTAAAPAVVRLMPVICTFHRDRPLAELLGRLGSDAEAMAALAGVVVVNNGQPGLAARLDSGVTTGAWRSKLHVIEQPNFGGAGGFSRGLLAAREAGATHAILMDDDVAIEPEAVLRTARLYAVATTDMVVAGHMLDLFRPTHLYEAGACLVDSRLSFTPLHQGAELSHPGALDRFLDEVPMHYNGWWFMGLPVTLLDRVGWPMPCFIRGDDVEFGRRLHDAGVPFVATPGIGIWHEPFYAKLGSWHAYYELRNMFVLTARHLPKPARVIAFVALKWIVAELLMFRYQRAALLLHAAGHFLDGPAIYACDPGPLHAELQALRRRYPVGVVRREQVVYRPQPGRGPGSRAAFVLGVGGALWSEWWRRDGGGRTIAVEPRDHVWFRIRGADAVIVREPWEVEQPVYRRSRTIFRSLFGQSVRLALRLRHVRRAVAEWRQAHGDFTTEAAWRQYLGLEPAPLASSNPCLCASAPESALT